MNTTIQNAYRIVLNKAEKSLFLGNYDAKNGNQNFMHGIGTVMEFIAYNVSEKDGDTFSEMFTNNMIESERAGNDS